MRAAVHITQRAERYKMLRKKEHAATFLRLDTMRQRETQQSKKNTDKIDIVGIFYIPFYGWDEKIRRSRSNIPLNILKKTTRGKSRCQKVKGSFKYILLLINWPGGGHNKIKSHFYNICYRAENL